MAEQRSERMDLSGAFGVLRRGALIIVVAVVATAAGAYIISKGKPNKYSANTELLLQGAGPSTPADQAQFAAPNPSDASDRESLVTSGDAIKRAARILERRGVPPQAANSLVGGVSAASAPDSSIVTLSATASDPKQAALAANALAQANIESRLPPTLREGRRGEASSRRQLADLGAPNAQNSPAYTTVSGELVNLRRQAETADGDARVIKSATPPASPSSPKPKRNALIAGFGGLLLGLALALVREQVDRRVRHPKELEDTFGLPVLASVPRSRALAASNGKALDPLPARDAEAFQILRANLRYLNTE